MALNIVWSSRALSDLENTKEYLINTWGQSSLNKFLDILEQKISIIMQFPESCPKVAQFKNVRKCVLTPQNTLFYRIVEGEIEIESLEILRIFDNRQDPDKLGL